MDPLRIMVRVLFGYVFLRILSRISGSRALKQVDAPSFVIAIVIGDMFDDLFWSEVPASQFVVAVATLFLIHLRLGLQAFHSGNRNWLRAASSCEK